MPECRRNAVNASTGRRRFLRGVGGTLAAGIGIPAFAAASGTDACPVTTDLMHEHGLIMRVLLIYGQFRKQLEKGEKLDPDLLGPVSNLVATVVHGHHEQVEEKYVFARLRGVGDYETLVGRLTGQHRIGRELTATIAQAATPAHGQALGSERLNEALGDFIALYAPHEAREDSVVFPAFERHVSAKAMAAMREELVERERQALGADWFPEAVQQIATVEKALGIHQLKVKEPT